MTTTSPPTLRHGGATMTGERHYAFIPKTTLLDQRFKSMSVYARYLYVVMAAQRAGCDESFSFPYKEIREATRFRYEMISKSIKELSKAGFIEYDHGGLERNTNKYFLEPSWLEL